ncbi:PEP-CTERM sorting domain-containing protein [Alkalilimnicola ehrlichii MLHE-1]|uniref:Uncharacterized protein n=1 Tax=Alkalilimnicola ehrlichii (strain ATCC BAA-1101 / DSM 17681 / MLHE-1) TaxID=187272 RepID=Q0A7D2_ALKEH|nr:PEP-CTERM sorting domain-containing protein [Alkalilimnicola ehrlichii]ABI57255.1 hypothetical protein Mlg_1911 [Alkalilimnicola ehrlichii MLHE-1]
MHDSRENRFRTTRLSAVALGGAATLGATGSATAGLITSGQIDQVLSFYSDPFAINPFGRDEPDFFITTRKSDTYDDSKQGTLAAKMASKYAFEVETTGGNSIHYPGSSVGQLPEGALVDDALDWLNSDSQLRARTSHWPDGSSGYVGLLSLIDDQSYYGWMEVSIQDEGDFITVHQWAFNDSPDASLQTGDIGTTAIPEPSSLLLFAGGAAAWWLGSLAVRLSSRRVQATTAR